MRSTLIFASTTILVVGFMAACAQPPTITRTMPSVNNAKASSSLSVVPTSLKFVSKSKLYLTISQVGFAGRFRITVSPKGIVSLPTSQVNGPGPRRIPVTAIAGGKAKIVVSSAPQEQRVVSASVTQGVIVINERHGGPLH